MLAKGFLVRGLIHAYVGDVRQAIACQGEFLGCYDDEHASLLHENVGAGELAAHIALRQGRPGDVLSALDALGSPRRGHWFHAGMLAASAHFTLRDDDALAAQGRRLRAVPEPLPWVAALVDRVEGLRALLVGDAATGADLLRSSATRLAGLGLPLAADLGWLEWAELGRGGHLDAEASDLVEKATTELTRMGAHEAAERGRRLLRGAVPAPVPPGRSGQLTGRELQVALLVAQGLSNAEIAERLIVSTRTVTTHLTHVYGRLGLSGRTALAHHMHTRAGAEPSETPASPTP